MYDQPCIIPIKESGDLYRLQHDYKINLHNYGYYITITIPAGFTYDGASVPRWLWSLTGLGIDGLHRAACLVHDYLYVQRGKIISFDGAEKISLNREQVDMIFKQMLIDASIAEHRIAIAYKGVRWFGQSYWDS